jgi:hypothetical protein
MEPMTAVLIALGMFLVLAIVMGISRVHLAAQSPIEFQRSDTSRIDQKLESVAAKLAAEDVAAFAFYPAGPSADRDADGQVWLFGAGEGALQRVSIELSLPDWVTAPGDHPAVAWFIERGWESEESEPGQWVLLSQYQPESAAGLAGAVVAAISGLFSLRVDLQWRCHPIT